MCGSSFFYGKMSWCLIRTLEWKCCFHPSAIMGFLSPPLLLLFYFLTERQGGTPLPAQLGHWGLFSETLRWEAEGSWNRTLHLCFSVWSWGSLMEEPRQSISGEDGCPRYHRPPSAHSRTLWVQLASLMGHQSFPGHMFVLVKVWACGLWGRSNLKNVF